MHVLCYRCATFKEVSAILHEEIHIQRYLQYVVFGIFRIFHQKYHAKM